jgi:hypothetical protein
MKGQPDNDNLHILIDVYKTNRKITIDISNAVILKSRNFFDVVAQDATIIQFLKLRETYCFADENDLDIPEQYLVNSIRKHKLIKIL